MTTKTFAIFIFLLPWAIWAQGHNNINDPDNSLLGDNYSVYSNGNTVINHPQPGFKLKTLTTNNDYRGNPGCYITCYSHSKDGIYAVSSDIFVMGQIRVPGKYNERICQPTGYENKDISSATQFKSLCHKKIKACAKTDCWAGGDTGGWFGIQ